MMKAEDEPSTAQFYGPLEYACLLSAILRVCLRLLS